MKDGDNIDEKIWVSIRSAFPLIHPYIVSYLLLRSIALAMQCDRTTTQNSGT